MSTMHFSVHVEGLSCAEVMGSMRRMMLKPYLILWVVVYAFMLAIAIFKDAVSVFTLVSPAVLLLILAAAYERTGRKNYASSDYDKAVMDYSFTPKGYQLTVGDKTAEFTWQQAKLVKTRVNYLLYSDKHNCSILPLRCLTEEQKAKLTEWAGK